jgi:hypothetical protein
LHIIFEMNLMALFIYREYFFPILFHTVIPFAMRPLKFVHITRGTSHPEKQLCDMPSLAWRHWPLRRARQHLHRRAASSRARPLSALHPIVGRSM